MESNDIKIARLEENMKSVEQKVDEVKEILEKFIETAEDKFASKWVERAIWGGAATVGVAIILAVLSLVLIK